MKITAISDTHGTLPDVEPTDVLIIAGDVCPMYSHDLLAQEHWLKDNFAPWLTAIDAKHILGIGGNHDFIFEVSPTIAYQLPWTYLCGTSKVVEGLKFYGAPWVPNLPRWAFHKSEEGLREAWESIPEDVDVLITHGPPAGFGDEVDRIFGHESFHHVGDPILIRQYTRICPDYHFFGHIHEGRGSWKLCDQTTLANVSMLDARYDRDNREPMEFHYT